MRLNACRCCGTSVGSIPGTGKEPHAPDSLGVNARAVRPGGQSSQPSRSKGMRGRELVGRFRWVTRGPRCYFRLARSVYQRVGALIGALGPIRPPYANFREQTN